MRNINKPVLVGVTILELSKLRMYEMWYLTLKKCFGDRLRLLMTDTDSFVFEVTRDSQNWSWIEELVRKGFHDEFDLSVYPEKHPAVKAMRELGLDPQKNKGVLGKFKDECATDPIKEFIGLRPKMYAYRTKSNHVSTRAKGVKKAVKEAEMDFTLYAKALFNEAQVVEQRCPMIGIRSLDHILHTYQVNKKLISPADSKLWISAPFRTLPFGHYRATPEQSQEWSLPHRCSKKYLGYDFEKKEFVERVSSNCVPSLVDEAIIYSSTGKVNDDRCLFCRVNRDLPPAEELVERARKFQEWERENSSHEEYQ